MSEDPLSFTITPRDKSSDGYDWIDIDTPTERVGKSRCHMEGYTLIIYSIMVFPEFQGRGYGTRTLEMLKAQYPLIVADRVRFTAQGFWERMGFHPRPDGNWQFP